MKRKSFAISTIFISAFILFVLSCSSGLNGNQGGSVSIYLPGSNSRYSDLEKTELPAVYDILLTRNDFFTKEYKANAGSVVKIDNLIHGKYDIVISGSTDYFYFEGKNSVIVNQNKDTDVSVQLIKFRKALYADSSNGGDDLQNGTIGHPFEFIETAYDYADDAENILLSLAGTFTDFTSTGSRLQNLYIRQTPGKSPAQIKLDAGGMGDILVTSYTLDVMDVVLGANILLRGDGRLKIGGSTYVPDNGFYNIALINEKPITITAPLSASFAGIIAVNDSTAGGTLVLEAGNSSVDIARECGKFKIADKLSGPKNQFDIGSDGRLIKNKPVRLTLSSTEIDTHYSYEIKEKGNPDSLIPMESYIVPGPSDYIKKDGMTYCFSVGKTYVVYISKDGTPFDQQQFTISNDNDVFELNVSVRSTLTVPEAIQIMGNGANNAHTLLVSVASADEFKTLGDGIKSKLGNGGSVELECVTGGSISAIPQSAFAGCGSKLTKIIIPEGISSIGVNAFSGNSGLNSVLLPGTLTSIENGAFSGCGISQVRLPDGIVSIGDNAFENCSNITSIDLSSTTQLSSIGAGAFKGSGVTEITVPDSVSTLEDVGVIKLNIPCTLPIADNTTVKEINVRLKGSSKAVPDSAYKNCSALQTVTLPDGLTGIGKTVFDGSGVTELNIPLTVTSVGDGLQTSSITTITTPCNLVFGTAQAPDYYGVVSYIGNKNLTNVTIKASTSPDVVDKTKVADNAFEDSSKLTTVTLEGITEIGIRSFYRCSGNYGREGLTNLIDDSNKLVKINKEAFYNCPLLKSFPFANITTIGEASFALSGITEINAPKLSTLEREAFKSCNNLNSIISLGTVSSLPVQVFAAGNSGDIKFDRLEIPSSVTDLGYYSLMRCEITELIIPETVKKINQDAFSEAIIGTVTVRGTNSWNPGGVILEKSNITNLQQDITR